jgi:Zn-dependent protease with chaperone function
MNKIIKLLLLSTLFIFMPMHADMRSIVKNIVNNYTIGISSTSSLLTDNFQFRVLGSKDLSPELQKKIDKILIQLGLHGKIQVKQMSDFAIQQLGAHNALATANAIFINEETFKTLTYEEQCFLIGHEVGHVKNKDILYGVAYSLLGAVIVQKSLKHIPLKISKPFADPVCWLSALLTRMAYQRYAEKEADRHAIEKLNCHDGAILWNARFTIADEVLDDSFPSRIKAFVGWLFSTHPTQQERIAFAAELKNETQK